MEKCEKIEMNNCHFYYSNAVRGFEGLSPEYKEKICHGNYMDCDLWLERELSAQLDLTLKKT